MTVDLPGYGANHKHLGVWRLLWSLLCHPNSIKRTKGGPLSEGSVQILAACHELSIVKSFKPISQVTVPFNISYSGLIRLANIPPSSTRISCELSFQGLSQKAGSGRQGTALAEDSRVNFIARHRTITLISHLWVTLATLLGHHTITGRKVLIFYIWRLDLTVSAFPFRRGKHSPKSQAQVRNLLQVSVKPVEDNGGKREKALSYYDLS